MSEETITITKKEYEELKKTNEELIQRNTYLWEQIRLAKKNRFGKSSEQTKRILPVPEQSSFIFNEIEQEADRKEQEESESKTETTIVKEHTRRKKSMPNLDDLPENIKKEVIENELPEEERFCSRCGAPLVEIGVDVIQRVKIIPAQVIIVETRTHIYKCQECLEQYRKMNVVRAKEEAPVIPGGIATAESVAYIATEKFVMHSPLYRLEQQFKFAGIPISRQTMSNWLLKATKLYLSPIWKRMKERLLKEEILHADETTLQVLHEPDRPAERKSYMWLYRTGRESKQQIVLYEYKETREAKHPKEFLKGYKGYLHVDGYEGYHRLPSDIHIVGCMAHARRYFDEAITAEGKNAPMDSPARKAIEYYDKLFLFEEQIKDLSPEERTKYRKEHSVPVLNEFHEWLTTIFAAPKSALGKAIHYTLEQWPYLTAFMEDGRLEISNNRAERSIKPFVIGRKNFLFANTPKGAYSSAVIFSIIETAKENGLDPYRYLVWVLKTAPTLKMNNPQQVDLLLPAHAPSHCLTGK